jgi:energy-coupling factor transport system substrate-specific component
MALASRTRSQSWSTRDIVVTAALAVACGVSFIVVDWIYLVATGLFGQITQPIFEGLWLTGALIVPYIVRRPGAALFGELVASVVEASFNPFGITVIIAGLLEGVGAEIVFALTGYKRFSWPVMALAGAVDALLFFVVWQSWRSGYLALSGGIQLKMAPLLILGYLAVEVISGAVAGWLSKGVGDALVPTGVLDGFPIAANRTPDI